MRVRPRSELIDVMQRVGIRDQVPAALQRLPEIVDLDRDGQLLYEMGLSLDQLVDRLGGSAW